MFPCNFNFQNPFVERVEGIVNCYRNTINEVQLFGPTNFAPIIRETARMAGMMENMRKA